MSKSLRRILGVASVLATVLLLGGLVYSFPYWNGILAGGEKISDLAGYGIWIFRLVSLLLSFVTGWASVSFLIEDRQLRYRVHGVAYLVYTFSANVSALFFLALLLIDIFAQGMKDLDMQFLLSFPSRFPEQAGILSSIVGTLWMMLITALFAVPMGVGAAIYLEEYARNTRIVQFIKLNIQNLAGVPSIVYGILGLTLFVRFMDLGRSLLAGSLTMALVILPIITISTQEALRAVPDSFRHAGFGIGMTRWQVVRYEVLPMALPGMLTGVILALSRAIGETAPLIMIGALTFVAFLPQTVFDSFTVLPIQIYNWTARPQAEFHEIAASAIIVLLVILLSMNAIAIFFRSHFHSKMKGINN